LYPPNSSDESDDDSSGYSDGDEDTLNRGENASSTIRDIIDDLNESHDVTSLSDFLSKAEDLFSIEQKLEYVGNYNATEEEREDPYFFPYEGSTDAYDCCKALEMLQTLDELKITDENILDTSSPMLLAETAVYQNLVQKKMNNLIEDDDSLAENYNLIKGLVYLSRTPSLYFYTVSHPVV